MERLSTQEHIDLVVSVAKIETSVEILTQDVDQLHTALSNHMIEESKERQETAKILSRLTTLVIALILIASGGSASSILPQLLGVPSAALPLAQPGTP